jgi:ribosomal protein S14
MANEPIEVESIREQRSCKYCGQPSGIFDECKPCLRKQLRDLMAEEW